LTAALTAVGLFGATNTFAAGSGAVHVAKTSAKRAMMSCSEGGWSIDVCSTSVSMSTFDGADVDIALSNYSGTTGTVAVTSDCAFYFSACAASPNNPTLTGDGDIRVITFHMTSRGTSGSTDVHVTFSGDNPTMVATIHVTISGPSHTLTVDATKTNNDFQSAVLCAVSCFAANYSFSTVPFFTLDQPRSVTLTYNGDRALPRPFIFAYATPDNSGTSVARYALSAKVSGSPVTFTNGDATLYFSGATGERRLAGQFDARSYSTGVYPMSIIVTATYADSAILADTVSTELMVVNEGSSYAGKGWAIDGLQRLYFPSTGYMIAEGDGTATRFTALNTTGPDYTVLSLSNSVYTRTYPDGTRALFDTSGYLTSVVDIYGRSTTFDYDGSNRLARVKDPMAASGSAVQYDSLTYTSSGIASIIEKTASATLRTTSVTIGTNGSISAIQDPDGVSTSFTYDGCDRLSTVTDRKGSTTTLAYNSVTWKLSSLTMPTVAVDAGSGSTSNTQPVVTYSPWQSVGLPTSSTSWSSPAAAPASDTIYGRVTDAVGNVSKFTTDRWGQPKVATNAVGQTTTFLRTGFLPYEIDRVDGGVDQFTYDSYGRVVWQQASGREATGFTRHGPYAQVDTVGGNGSRTQVISYNANAQVSRITYAVVSGSSPYTDFTYNATTKRVYAQTDQDGHTNSFTYDSKFGNLAVTSDPGGRGITKTFDAYGRDSTSQTTGMTTFKTLYDVMNRPTRFKDGVNADSMLVRYDAMDDTTLTDRRGNTYRTVRNALGWVTQSCDASSNCSTFRYNANGELTSSTNRRSQRVDLVRDALGRVTSKSGSNTSSDSFSYAFNGHDYVASNGVETDSVFVSPGSGTAAGNDSVVTRIGGMRFRTFHYSRRGMSGVDSTSIITSLSSLVMNPRKYFYSAVGLLDSLKTGSHNIRLSLNTEELPSKFTSSGGVEESFTSTALLMPRDRRNNYLALDSAFRRSYHYDSVARLDKMQNVTKDEQFTYTYDLLGQLTKREKRSSCSLTGTDSLSGDGSGMDYSCTTLVSADTTSYDAMGNRTDHGASVGTGNRLSALNGGTISYDADGNVTQRAKSGDYTIDYFWSSDERLDSLKYEGSVHARYDYNALGKPVAKYTKYGPTWGGVASYFIWDGDQLLLELDGSGNRRADYVYFPGTIDQPAMETIGATSVTAIREHRMDASGNVTGTVDGSAVSQTLTYDAWGAPTAGGNTENQLMWKGLLFQSDVAGIYYVRNRWYDPALGRFLSEDPIGQAGGDNLYTFGGNDPINERDANGLLRESCTIYYIVTWNTFTGQIFDILGTFVRCEGGGGDGGGGGGRSVGPSPTKAKSPTCADAPGVLKESIRAAEQHKWDPLGLVWFYSQVNNLGPQDYKQKNAAYEPFGNFNYGAMGAAMGVNLELLLRAAGRNQMQKATYRPSFGSYWKGPPFGDDPHDQMLIRAGYDYYKRGCQ